MRGWIEGGLVLILLLVLTVGPAAAEDQRLQQAAALRDASTVDFNEKRHAAAAEKLRQAAAIYESVPDAPVADRAITLRALIWNEVLDGQIDASGGTFERLILLVKDQPDYQFELDSAWLALFRAANTIAEFEKAEAFLASARYAAKNAALQRMAAQITHSTASIASAKKEFATAVSYLEDAIAQREAIGDQTGLAWSLNNLANCYLVNLGKLPEGLAAIVEAHGLVQAEGALEVQPAVSLNVRTALEMVRAYDGELDDLLKGIDALIKQSEGGQVRVMFSLPWLYRERLALAVRGGNTSAIQKAATAMTRAKLEGYPDEARADLAITAIEAMINAGKASKVKSWIAKVECGEGPAAAHLDARLGTVRALVAADTKKKKLFVQHANRAAALWKELDDWQGERDALLALTEAAAARGYSADIPDVTARYASLRGSGMPGGAGGSASGRNTGAAASLAPTDTLFEIFFEDDFIVLEDKAAGSRQGLGAEWAPKSVGLNGLSVQIFGGYVVVKSLNYGGSASAGGVPGATRLSDLGDYLPVPATGALVIQKDGGVRYRR